MCAGQKPADRRKGWWWRGEQLFLWSEHIQVNLASLQLLAQGEEMFKVDTIGPGIRRTSARGTPRQLCPWKSRQKAQRGLQRPSQDDAEHIKVPSYSGLT